MTMSKNTVTVSEKGAIVIPKEIRERYGIGPGDKVQVLDWAGRISLVKIPPGDPIERMRGLLAGGPSMTEALLEDRRWELEREERDLPPPRSHE
jgi:AbrB family looped-hinge helix DNA binding protein